MTQEDHWELVGLILHEYKYKTTEEAAKTPKFDRKSQMLVFQCEPGGGDPFLEGRIQKLIYPAEFCLNTLIDRIAALFFFWPAGDTDSKKLNLTVTDGVSFFIPDFPV